MIKLILKCPVIYLPVHPILHIKLNHRLTVELQAFKQTFFHPEWPDREKNKNFPCLFFFFLPLKEPLRHRLRTELWLCFWVLNDGGQLLMVSHQNKSPGVEKRSETDGLADLRRLVYDAEVEPSTGEDRMFDAHAGGGYDQLKHQVTNSIFQLISTTYYNNIPHVSSLLLYYKAAPAPAECERSASSHCPPCTAGCPDEPEWMWCREETFRALLNALLLKIQL